MYLIAAALYAIAAAVFFVAAGCHNLRGTNGLSMAGFLMMMLSFIFMFVAGAHIDG